MTPCQVIIHPFLSAIFLFPPFGVLHKVSLPDWLSWGSHAAGFPCCGVPVLWWEGRQKRHERMLLFISVLSCVWIWLQVAKSIFSFCRRHHRRRVYFFWAPVTSAANVMCGSQQVPLPGRKANNESAGLIEWLRSERTIHSQAGTGVIRGRWGLKTFEGFFKVRLR